MLTFKDYLKDWRFYFKLFFGLFFLAVLLYHWLNPIINGIYLTDEQKAEARNWEWFIQDKGDYTLNFLSYFTIQTNIMVALWLILSALFHDQEGKQTSKWFNNYMALAVTTYITITFVVFNTMLLPRLLNRVGFFFWFTLIIEHILVPIVMIVYYLFFMKKEKTTVLATKAYLNKYLIVYYFYPLFWLIIMLIRGEFRYHAGKAIPYQYFFINVHSATYGLPGWLWLIIAMFIVGILIFGISTLFNLVAYKSQGQQTKAKVKNKK